MRKLAIDELLRDDPDHLAAARKGAVRDRAHQPNTAAAVDEAEPALGQSHAEGARRLRVGGIAAARSSTEDADSVHGARLPADAELIASR